MQAQYLANRQAYDSALAQERALLDNLGADLSALGLRPSDLFPAGDAQMSPRPE